MIGHFLHTTFAGYAYWWLSIFVAIAAVLLCYLVISRTRTARILSGRWQQLLLKRASTVRYMAKAILFFLALLCIYIAILRPQWGHKDEAVSQKGRDFLIALDVSRSMLATDNSPNRLTFAKEKIKQLVSHLQCERVGLILFSGSAFVQCPLTSDYRAFELFLNQVDVETISSGSTALDQALMQAIKTYEQMENKKTKLLALFTDGEDFSTNLAEFKEKAQKYGLHLFACGVGSPQGAPIPLFDRKGKPVGHQKDQRGSIVISRLNESLLSQLAADVGGEYVQLRDDQSDIKQLVRKIETFEKEDINDITFAQLQDRYHYFLLGAWICLVLEWLL